MEEKERNKKYRIWIRAFAVFMIFMWLCTVISKSIYVSGLPRVQTQQTEKKYIEHIVEAEGIIIEGGEQAVNTLPGLRVQKIYAKRGDRVEAGDVLFQIDTADLRDMIQEQESAIHRLNYQIADMEFNQTLDEQNKEIGKLWAQEDYESADRKTAADVERAEEARQEAQRALEEHLNEGYPLTSEEDRRKAEQKYSAWEERLKSLQNAVAEQERVVAELEKQLGQSSKSTSQKAPSAAQETTSAKTSTEVPTEPSTEVPTEPSTEVPTEPPTEVPTEPSTEAPTESSAEPSPLSAASTGRTLSGSGTPDSSDPADIAGKLEEARKELARRESELEAHYKNAVERPDFSVEDSGYKNWQQETESLRKALRNAEYAKEDAVAARNSALQQESRDVANSLVPDRLDSSVEQLTLQLADMQRKLSEYYALLRCDGKVTSVSGGTVTNILISTGGRTTDTAALLLTEDETPCQFRMTVTKEQKKYINIGDSVEVTFANDGTKLLLTVDYLTESTAGMGYYDLYMQLPQGVGQPGNVGSISQSVQGELRNCCIPIEALYGENGRYYVYLLKEKEGILGMELYVERMDVRVLDKNDRFAALEEGTLTGEDKIITYATEAVKRGDTVRYME